MLGEPDPVEAESVGKPHLGQLLVIDLGLRLGERLLHEMKRSKAHETSAFHGQCPRSFGYLRARS